MMNKNKQIKEQIVKFGDIAKRVNDLHPDKDKWNFKRYVTGRDFEIGEIRIKNSRPIKGNKNLMGHQFKWRFQPGDILYVVKNPRLRKAAIVDFEGICSISTYVIRTDETKFLQKLLPFLMQTEKFTTYARRNEHGSTNPFLNWKDIAEFQFYLPSLDEQKEISKILWTIEKHIENLELLIDKTKNYISSRRESLLTRGIEHKKFKKVKWVFGKEIEIPDEWEIKKLEEVVEILDGKRIPLSETEREKRHGSFPYYGASGVIDYIDDYIFNEKLLGLAEDGENLRSRTVPIAFTIEGKTWVNNHAHVLRVKIDHNFLKYFLNNLSFHQYVASTAQPKLTQKDMRIIPIICPPLDEQQKIVSILLNIDKQITQQQSHLTNLKVLRNSILNSKLTKEK
jgi:type I restriction enzyme, S subunit